MDYYATNSVNTYYKPTTTVEVLAQYSCFSHVVEGYIITEKISLTSNLRSSCKEGGKYT